VDWNAGNAINKTVNLKLKKQILFLSLFVNLFLLGTFKYLDFIIETFNFVSLEFGPGVKIETFNLLLPVGISFYTFQTMSYTIDIFREKIKPMNNFWEFACYAAFFPQLVAGPIVRNSDFRNQIEKGIKFKYLNLKIGITLICYGLFKKIVIADNIANQVNHIFTPGNDFSNFFLVSYGAFLFGIQIYCDFSAYSTIAIGSAKLFDINLPENFKHPFFSHSPQEFWKRWHISLSSWLRDYLYIPLGGSKNGNKILIFSLMGTMLLGGLWHGASWNFVLWGFLHGLLLLCHRFLSTRTFFNFYFSKYPKLMHIISCFITQYFVFLTWLVFRLEDLDILIPSLKAFLLVESNFDIFYFYSSLPNNSAENYFVGRFFVIGILVIFLIFHIISYRLEGLEKKVSDLPPFQWSFLMGTLIGLTIILRTTTPVDFIYFRF